MRTLMYLRKSREDQEAEKRGEGETLARHEAALMETAKRMQLPIDAIYREVVSGETISDRPMMQRLLNEVEKGLWDNILVMEVERLARGDSIDQGVISRAFTYSGTKIVTPLKTYDPSNEFDSEYFEFSLFMSRREYKMINRRMQRGRMASVREGKFAGNKAPYGYQRIKIANDKGYTLKPIPDQAEVIVMIFEWFVNGASEHGSFKRLGASLIANRLNQMGIKPLQANAWTYSTISGILKNPVYAGNIRWNSRKEIKSIEEGVLVKKRPRNPDPFITAGLHPPLISETQYNQAQQLLTKKQSRIVRKISNPMAGLIKCGHCGHAMKKRKQGRKTPYDTLICDYPNCICVSSALDLVEERVLTALDDWLANYLIDSANPSPLETGAIEQNQIILLRYQIELKEAKNQLLTIYDLLEKGLYSESLFLQRSGKIHDKIQDLQIAIADIEIETRKLNERLRLNTQLETDQKQITEIYRSLNSPEDKNILLKEIIYRIEYRKNEGGRWQNSMDKFELIIYPKIPRHHTSITHPSEVQKN